MTDPGSKTVPRFLFCWLAILCVVLLYTLASTGPSHAEQTDPQAQAEDQPSPPVPVPGMPLPADHAKLSEHNILWLKGQPAQGQMEFLFAAAVNHDEGATEEISKRLEGWH